MPQISRELVLANAPEEVTALSAQGMEVVFCRQNAFLDEQRHPILPFLRKRYDAHHFARITPFKRHAQLREIESLRLISEFSEEERGYTEETLRGRRHHLCFVHAARCHCVRPTISACRMGGNHQSFIEA